MFLELHGHYYSEWIFGWVPPSHLPQGAIILTANNFPPDLLRYN